ncbi:hypothetical protein [Kouleothrix sp.]
MAKKKNAPGSKSTSAAGKGGFKQPLTRSTPLSRRPPRQPGR